MFQKKKSKRGAVLFCLFVFVVFWIGHITTDGQGFLFVLKCFLLFVLFVFCVVLGSSRAQPTKQAVRRADDTRMQCVDTTN